MYPIFSKMFKALWLDVFKKISAIVSVLLIGVSAIHGQTVYNTPPDYYSVPMKRMLVQSLGNYINQVTQGELDLDSATLIGCQMYKINRLLPYNEGFDGNQTTPGMILINSGKIDQARKELPLLKGDDKIRRCLELSSYFLFKPGHLKTNLDNSKLYLDMAFSIAGPKGALKWTTECYELYGKYFAQTDELQKSQDYFKKAILVLKDAKNEPALGNALAAQAKFLPYNSPDKLRILQQCLALAKKSGNKILEIQALDGILTVHFTLGNPVVGSEILKLVELEKAIGFRHLQYTYHVISYMDMVKSRYDSAHYYAQLSLRSMQETGDKVLAPLFYQRMGEVIGSISSREEALHWFQKAMDIKKTKQNQVFWYKSFLVKARVLNSLNRYKEALTLIKSISTTFPPTNDFDKLGLAYTTGLCYLRFNEFDKAEEQFNIFLTLSERFPAQYIHGELPTAYLAIAELYFYQKKYAKAKNFIQKAVSAPHGLESVLNETNRFELLFKLDSVAGNNIAAIKDYQAYKLMSDSLSNLRIRQNYKELQVRFESVNKDRNIKLLKQNNEIQSARLRQDVYFRNMILWAVVLISVIALLLYYLYRVKQRSNTQLQGQQKVLERLITEKEWLVKEIHHRVKNNLHTIVSLLESQSAYLKNDDALSAVRDSQHRIHAMSLIHQKLYMGEDMMTINSAAYIKELVSYLNDSFKLEGRIMFQTEIEEFDLDVAVAIPLGLIINEAVTNAIKYAFDGPGGSVKITLKKTGEVYLLEIADDGIGLPLDFNINKRISSLGMTLMKGLSKEIGAQFTITSNKGTSITILFPPYKVSQ
jgi:two-component sensor histidine kinase